MDVYLDICRVKLRISGLTMDLSFVTQVEGVESRPWTKSTITNPLIKLA